MSNARFFTDEDVYTAIAPALRKAGYDAVSTPEADRLNESDDSQLEWAVQEGRTFVTFNVGHFADRHAKWLEQERHHRGIVVSSQRPIGELLRRLIHLAQTLEAEALVDRLEYLSNW